MWLPKLDNDLMKKILVIIPAYNEAKNIGLVIDEIKRENLSLDILVVNDGSKDGTSDIARKHGAVVADLPTNLGIGGARQTGLLYAMNHEYEICIQMDADGQHSAQNIKYLIESAQKNEVVIGSRFIENKYKGAISRRLGIIFLSFFLKLIIKKKITDPTSGLRAISGKAIPFLAKYYPVDYPEVEPIVFLYWAGFEIKEIPVMMRSRMSGDSSIAPLNYMIKVILAILIDCLREKPKI